MADPWVNSEDEEEDLHGSGVVETTPFDVGVSGSSPAACGFGSSGLRNHFGAHRGSRANSADSGGTNGGAGPLLLGAASDVTAAAHTIAELQDKVLVLQAQLDAAEADQRLPATANAAVLAADVRVTPAAAQEALRRGLQLQRKQYLQLLEQLTANLDAKERAQRAKVVGLQEANKRTEDNAQALCLELGRVRENFSELEQAHKRLQRELEVNKEMHSVETRSLRQIVATLQAELAASGVTTDAASRAAAAAAASRASTAEVAFPGDGEPESRVPQVQSGRSAPPPPPPSSAIGSAGTAVRSPSGAGAGGGTAADAEVTAAVAIGTNIRARVLEFYREHNPAKVGDVDGILEKFAGRERELLVRLHEKYSITVPADIMFTDESDQFVVVVPRGNQHKERAVLGASPASKPPAAPAQQKKASALGKMFGATLGRVFRSASSTSAGGGAASGAGASGSGDGADHNGRTGTGSGASNTGGAVGQAGGSRGHAGGPAARSRSRGSSATGPSAGLGSPGASASGGDGRGARTRTGSGGSGASGASGGGGGGFFGFGRATKLKEEHAATLQKLQRDARERDAMHETERDTLKALVRQMSSEIEILKQKLADVQEEQQQLRANQSVGAGGAGGAGESRSNSGGGCGVSTTGGDVATRWH